MNKFQVDDLDALIEQANALFPKLHARRDEIECQHGNYGWDFCDQLFNYELRRKPAPFLPAPFTLKDSGHIVSFATSLNVVHVGCLSFDLDELTKALKAFDEPNRFAYTRINISLFATKQGPMIDSEKRISWADAEQLLAALEKAGK